MEMKLDDKANRARSAFSLMDTVMSARGRRGGERRKVARSFRDCCAYRNENCASQLAMFPSPQTGGNSLAMS